MEEAGFFRSNRIPGNLGLSGHRAGRRQGIFASTFPSPLSLGPSLEPERESAWSGLADEMKIRVQLTPGLGTHGRHLDGTKAENWLGGYVLLSSFPSKDREGLASPSGSD